MKILLVEDSATLRYAMRNYIVEAGHTALIAKSGEEALQMLETTPVDMIIMDVEMPGLNGFETTRLIREWLGEHWLPIIFVTGLNEDENYREGIDAGGDDYLIKPVSAMIIKAKIRAMERISEMRDQLNQLNAELEALSQLDSLTQIYNRRTFNEMAHQQWLLAARQQKPISVLMIDVDHFKLFNDHYGHPAGDSCLKIVTQCLRNCLQRPFDLLGRYGGEEFIILLPDTDSAGAASVSLLIQEKLALANIRHIASPSHHSVTISVGGASSSRTIGYSLEDLIKRADRALYKAKRSGRNCVIIDDFSINKTVLVVTQDNSDSMQDLVKILSEHFNILLTDSPDEALDICLDIHPDLILMDSASVDEHDERLCRQLSRKLKTNPIPIIVLSETSCKSRPISDASIGIRACLEVPVNTTHLLQIIQQIIP